MQKEMNIPSVLLVPKGWEPLSVILMNAALMKYSEKQIFLLDPTNLIYSLYVEMFHFNEYHLMKV